MMVQCCVCEKIRKGRQWVDPTPEEKISKEISHGYCPKCAAVAFEELHHQLQEQWCVPRRAASA